MIVTVCELPDDRHAFEDSWVQLAEHVRKAGGGLVVLPDMPFSRWFADATPVDPVLWNAAVAEHDAWERRLPELGAALVLGSRPIDFGNRRYNDGFAWDVANGIRSVHAKATPEFVPLEVDGVDIGLLIDEGVWADAAPRPYPPGEVDIIAMPRCTRFAGLAQRLERARALAAEAGAYTLSSNRGEPFEGQGWIVAADGTMLGTTTPQQPFLSMEIVVQRERALADRERMGPAPAWLDPLETGAPDYDPARS